MESQGLLDLDDIDRVGALAIWCQGPAPAVRAMLEHIGSSVEEHIIDVSRGPRSFAYAISTVSRGLKPQQES